MKRLRSKPAFRMAALIVALMGTTIAAKAQQATGDVTRQTAAIRLIDNKGTIKYIQVKNGLTALTNTTNDVTTTTFQLGGSLTDSTAINFNGKKFTFQGVTTATGAAATTATTGGVANGSVTGWTLMVRDEANGEIKKLLATDLVQSGQEVFTATAAQVAYPLTSSPTLPNFSKVWVYRNGAKLLGGVDYTVAASTVTLTPPTGANPDWTVYAGDKIEVQYVK